MGEDTEQNETNQSAQAPLGVDNAPALPVDVRPPVSHAKTAHTSAAQHAPQQPVRRSRRWLVVLIVVVVLGLGGAGAWAAIGHKPFDENKNINHNEYQALFLTNGQVYFGKLADLNHKFVTITDIYYLQVQQGDGSLQDASGNANSNSQVSLAKLGSELHGPEDKMAVSSDQVLFWENLKPDSKVVQAITKYQSQ
jgi:hypothetical protein